MIKAPEDLDLSDRDREFAKLHNNLCGCGTIKDAIDTATKMVCQSVSGDDCHTWHLVVGKLFMILYTNTVYAALLSKHPELPDEEVRDSLDKRIMSYESAANVIMAVNQQYAAQQINGPIRAAHNGETVETKQ